MRLLLRSLLPVFCLAALTACGGDDADDSGTPTRSATSPAASTQRPVSTPASTGAVSVGLEKLPGTFQRPTFVTNAGDGSGRLFVVEKPGRIRVIEDGELDNVAYLDITSIVKSTGNEQGLLGLAFHPDFAANGRFFVAYTAQDNKNTIAEYRQDPGGDERAELPSGKVLLAVADQYPNHNGGMLAFGPDGYLYIAMGDGGSGGDPDGNGQDLSAMLGKLLRIDVDSGSPYGIPPSNPFATTSGAAREVWAYGLRNPWRFSFDREAGDMWIADVGQNKLEEIDFQPADSRGGENYGWNTTEGSECYKPAEGCDKNGLVQPIFEYGREKGCSVTGGYVYRGKAIAALVGRYIFTDYCSATLWITTQGGDGRFTTIESGKLPGGISSFGEDESGEMYIAVDGAGAVYRLIPE